MILKEVSIQMQQYILSTETLLLTEFHFNTLNMFDDMTLLDFQFYINQIEKNVGEKNKRYSNTKMLATQLHMLKQVLNSMQI